MNALGIIAHENYMKADKQFTHCHILKLIHYKAPYVFFTSSFLFYKPILARRRKWSAQAHSAGKILFPHRIQILIFVIWCIFGVIFFRLFYLQVVKGEEFANMLQSQVTSKREILARRGNILTRDKNSNNLVELALNTSFDELRIDAQEIPDKKLVAQLLTPIIYTQKDHILCEQDPVFCPAESVTWPEPKMQEGTGEMIFFDPILPSFAEALQKKEVEIEHLINSENRYILIKRELSPEASEQIRELKKEYHQQYLQERTRLAQANLDPNDAQSYLKGVILEVQKKRYYPEKDLAAQVLGFVNRDNLGQYGIEGKAHPILSGKKGISIQTTDTRGRPLGISVDDFEQAIDGSNIVLTIDRIIQQKAEEILAQAVPKFRADSGQIIVMEPQTGFILAMANYPSFNPNFFGNVYLTRRTTPEDFQDKKIYKTTPLLKKIKNEEGVEQYIPATYQEYLDGWKLEFDPEFYVYENHVGPEAYKNKVVQSIYEPGSVFKPLVMAIALNEDEVTPFTKYYEEGAIEVQVGASKMPIRNADNKYLGWQTMTNILERSANVGMVEVAKKLGKGVLYKNLENFGFGKTTDIELDEEESGKLLYYKQWSLAHLYNHAFGQGISATPLQVIRAWCALANGGLLPTPHIIREVHHSNGQIQITEPNHRRVLKPGTSPTITAMLISAVENGVAKAAAIPGYKIAGKTGTSQIARTDGPGYESTKEDGSTITTFAGYAPAEDPQFVVLVKFDRPRIGDNTWGSTTAAPTFREIMQFLLEYYNIPPEE